LRGGLARVLLAVVLVALEALAPAALAENTTNTSLPVPEVSPSAPQPIVSFAGKVISFLLFLAIFGGLAAIAIGIFKFIAGGEDAGKWIARGLVALVLGLGFWAFIKFFL
jgi:hypothetical protein